jgi:thiazole synthase
MMCLGTDYLKIGNKIFNSRLMLGTGKYENPEKSLKSIEASNTEIITVAVRRVNKNNFKNSFDILNKINWKKIWILPNTAGSQTAEQAIRSAFFGRELSVRLGQENNNFIKLEVISDPKYLLPDPIGTLKAAEILIKEGFTVLPYINADPVLAKHLEDIGCATVMPLGSPIGSGQGIQNIEQIKIIIENAKVPVIIDAGIGKPSDVVKAMEIGADGVLLNTAVAKAKDPINMAIAMKLAVKSGRLGYKAGSILSKNYAVPSSPLIDFIF